MADEDFCYVELHWIQYVSTRQKLDESSVFGDPYQLTPINGSQHPDPYYYTKLLSFLELMAPEFAPVLRYRNKIPVFQLKTHYKMVPAICDLSNAMKHRNVQAAGIPCRHDSFEQFTVCLHIIV